MKGPAIVFLASAGAILIAVVGTTVWIRRKAVADKQTESTSPVKTGTEGDAELLVEAKNEFLQNCSAFIGIYEPVYRAANHRMKNMRSLFGDWNVRISYLKDAKSLQQLWNKLFSGFESWNDEMYVTKARSLLDLLSDFGVKRADTGSFTVDAKTYSEYYTLDGELIEAGARADVISPCWKIHEEVIEKGLIKRADAEEGSKEG